MGAGCHEAASGCGGLKLSLFGQDADGHYHLNGKIKPKSY
jgi:hypothetical protein